MLMDIIEQQQAEIVRHHEEMKDLLERTEMGAGKETTKVSLPKPTLQKFSSNDDIEHFLEMFECTAKQQEWLEDVWAMQLAELLMGKAMAAHAYLSVESVNDYPTVRQAILRHYLVNMESHR